MGRAAEPAFELLPQAVINADGLLQPLTQVLDFTKMFFQQVSPCNHPARTWKRWEVGNLVTSGAQVGVGFSQQLLSRIPKHPHPSTNCILSHGHSGTWGLCSKTKLAFCPRTAWCKASSYTQ